MGQPDNITVCKLCQRNFEKAEVGRIKILRREKKGESVLWVCSHCAGRIKFADH
jgi:RNase P subunit RPR2